MTCHVDNFKSVHNREAYLMGVKYNPRENIDEALSVLETSFIKLRLNSLGRSLMGFIFAKKIK